ncbi:hypothetical protein FH972_001621 [Carpinus fangiana]|uniref:Zn(2)-C6 fungal-type domain-containing protein n=1 Tax=Carpinus fangiana TaxID=176857 RepID=A0A5N6QCN3_9ROSI|nr:hypothetical protein FH972_001621 [Carpinus fangiana]
MPPSATFSIRDSTARMPTIHRPQPKLRQSCDACAEAKVKCGQERPRCDRCILHGNNCVYGVSRKHGSAQSRAKKKVHEKVTHQTHARSSSSEHSSPSRPTLVNTSYHKPLNQYQPSSNAGTENLTTNMFENMDALINPDLFGPLSVSDDLAAYLEPRADKNEHPYAFPFLQAGFPRIDGLSDKGQSRRPGSLRCNGQGQNTPNKDGSSHDCLSIASATLSTLYQALLSSSMHSYKAATVLSHKEESEIFDTILAVVKRAEETLGFLFGCPCAQEPHMAMLYSSVISLVIRHYQSAAGLDRERSPCMSQGSSSPDPVSLPNFGQLGHGPAIDSIPYLETSPTNKMHTRPGVSNPEDDDQVSFRLILLLRKLRQVSKLVDTLSKIGEHSNPATHDMFLRVGSWLNEELTQTISNVGDRARSFVDYLIDSNPLDGAISL